jgi:hypothetical protein
MAVTSRPPFASIIGRVDCIVVSWGRMGVDEIEGEKKIDDVVQGNAGDGATRVKDEKEGTNERKEDRHFDKEGVKLFTDRKTLLSRRVSAHITLTWSLATSISASSSHASSSSSQLLPTSPHEKGAPSSTMIPLAAGRRLHLSHASHVAHLSSTCHDEHSEVTLQVLVYETVESTSLQGMRVYPAHSASRPWYLRTIFDLHFEQFSVLGSRVHLEDNRGHGMVTLRRVNHAVEAVIWAVEGAAVLGEEASHASRHPLGGR